MIKKIIRTAIVGGALLGLAVGANAATKEINIYGASAQFLYWNAAAKQFLQNPDNDTTTSDGCASGDIYYATSIDGKTHGVTMCAGTDSIPSGDGIDGDTWIIRYTSKASYDGIEAVQGRDDFNQSSCSSDGSREMLDESYIDSTEWSNHAVTADTLTCKDVTIGASDVAADTFGQESHGHKKGPLAGQSWVDMTVSGVTIDETAYVSENPLVVPFAFFINADTNTGADNNITRLMATQIFNGQVYNWSQFGSDYDNQQIKVCLRHAGSGTHATLDAAVMRGDYTVLIKEKHNVTSLGSALGYNVKTKNGTAPYVWFNEKTGDMMSCIGGEVDSASFITYDGTTYSPAGAIGYADADAVAMDSTGIYDGKYGRIKLMTFQGVEPTSENIINGLYDFWSAQWMYYNGADAMLAEIEDLLEYAADGDNLAVTGKDDFWAAGDDMLVTKSNDFGYPIRK